jgi:hypothetical protein
MTEDFGSARFVADLRRSSSPWKLVDSADSLAVFRRA